MEITWKLRQLIMGEMNGFELRHRLEVDVIQRLQLIVIENQNLQLVEIGEFWVDRFQKIMLAVESNEMQQRRDTRWQAFEAVEWYIYLFQLSPLLDLRRKVS